MTLEFNITNQEVVTYHKVMNFGKCLCYELELTEDQLNKLGAANDIDKIEFYIKPVYKKLKTKKEIEIIWSNNE